MAAPLPDPGDLLGAYDLGEVRDLVPAGGTAGRTWKVVAAQGDFFLRLRGIRTSAEARLRFDHGLRHHLVSRGVPTVAAILTRAGESWQCCQGRVFELYPFVEGRPFCPDHEEEIAAAARALACFHLAAADYRPAAGPPEPVAQYTTLGFSAATSTRLDDPGLQQVELLGVRHLAATPADQQLVDRCLARLAHLAQVYAGPAYARLANWVGHGDYTPANLLFSPSGQVVGLFDLDWALPGSRCRDLADGLFFFGTRPHRLDGADIWSLTEAAEFDLDRGALFLQAYHALAPLAPEELEAIPAAFAGRWLSIRLEGMAKVAPQDRFRFFARDLEQPLRWLDSHWDDLAARLRLPVPCLPTAPAAQAGPTRQTGRTAG